MIRVLRLLEYTYETVEAMEADMGRWGVAANGSHWFNAAKPGLGIKSAVLPGTTLLDIPESAVDWHEECRKALAAGTHIEGFCRGCFR